MRRPLLVSALLILAACSGSSSSAGPTTTATVAPAPAPPTTAVSTPTTAVTGPAGPPVQRPEAPLPAAVQETAAAATADHLYVIGGYDGQQQSLSSVYVFDGSTWTAGPALPVALNHPAAAAIGAQVYEAGGFGASGASNRVFVLDAGAAQWREVAPMRHARGAAVLVSLGERLVAIGGRSGNTQVAPAEAYDPTSGHWTDLPSLPHPRNHLSAYVSGSSVCVTGGREPATSSRTDCLDLAASTWQPGPMLPTPTSGAAAGVLGRTVVVAGGEPADESSLVTDVQEWYDGTWSTEPMLTPRHGTGYALFGGRLWMCGGATAPGVHATTACTSFG